MKPFKIISRETLVDNPFCPIEKQIVELPNGKTCEWFVNTNKGAVIVMPILKNGEILLQKNYKHGCGKVIIEFCAGMIDPGETPEISAPRELKEETGYTAESFTEIRAPYSNPTGSQMQYHYVIALNAQKTHEPELEDAEQVETFTVKNIEEAKNFLLDPKTITTSGTIAGVLLLENFLTKEN